MTIEKKPSSKHSYVLASIPLDKIERKEQVRKDWRHDGTTKVDNEEALTGLRDSIKQHGILQPLIVKAQPGTGTYQLIAGHRRDVAAKRAGEDMAPCIIWDGSDEDIAVVQLIENLQRQDLSFADEARAMIQLMDAQNISATELARQLGCDRQRVQHAARIYHDPDMRSAVEQGLISTEAASRMMGLHADFQEPLWVKLRRGEKVTKRDVLARLPAARDREGDVTTSAGREASIVARQRIHDRHIAQARELRESGLSHRDIARQMGRSVGTVEQWLMPSRLFTPERLPADESLRARRVRELHAEGLSISAIASRLSMSWRMVQRYVEEDADATGAVDTPADPSVTFNGASLDNVIADAAAPPPAHPRPTDSPLLWENDPPAPPATPHVPVTVDKESFVVKVHDAAPVRTESAARSPIPFRAPDAPVVPSMTQTPAVPTLAPRVVHEPTLADLTVLLPEPPLMKLLAWAGGRGITAAQLYDEYRALRR